MVVWSQSPIGSVQRSEPPGNQNTPKTTICPKFQHLDWILQLCLSNYALVALQGVAFLVSMMCLTHMRECTHRLHVVLWQRLNFPQFLEVNSYNAEVSEAGKRGRGGSSEGPVPIYLGCWVLSLTRTSSKKGFKASRNSCGRSSMGTWPHLSSTY